MTVRNPLVLIPGGNPQIQELPAGDTIGGAPQGPAATITIGTVTSVANTDPATVTNSGTTTEAVLDFEIPEGEKGDQGDPGQGVPAGGTTGQVLAKIDATDYNTEWIDQSSGSGGATGRLPVQDKASGATGTNTNSFGISLASTPTNGNLLIACVGRDGTGSISSITQTGVTWSQVATSGTGSAPVMFIWKGIVGSGAGTSITIACSSTTFMGAHISEWSGITGTLDNSAIYSAQAGIAVGPRTPLLIPTDPDALVIGICGTTNNSTAYRNMWGMTSFDDMLKTACVSAVGFAFPGLTPVRGVGNANANITYSGLIVSIT